MSFEFHTNVEIGSEEHDVPAAPLPSLSDVVFSNAVAQRSSDNDLDDCEAISSRDAIAPIGVCTEKGTRSPPGAESTGPHSNHGSEPDANNISALIFASPLLAASSDTATENADGVDNADNNLSRMLEKLVVDVPPEDDEEGEDSDHEEEEEDLIFECAEHKKLRKQRYLIKDEETGLYHCVEDALCKSANPATAKKKRAKKKQAANASGSSIGANNKSAVVRSSMTAGGRSSVSLPVSSSASSRFYGNSTSYSMHHHPHQQHHHHFQAPPPPPPPAYVHAAPPQQPQMVLLAAPSHHGGAPMLMQAPPGATMIPAGYPTTAYAQPQPTLAYHHQAAQPTAYVAYQAAPTAFSPQPQPHPQQVMIHPQQYSTMPMMPQQPTTFVAAAPYGAPQPQQYVYYVLPDGSVPR